MHGRVQANGNSALAAEERRRTYHTLDALRGAAALIVMFRHADYLFKPLVFSENFLAVDLFFVMSGVVIANAYEGRLLEGHLSPTRFVLTRVIRLYPLYLLGVGFALLQFVGNSIEHHAFSVAGSAWALGLALLMIPGDYFSVKTLDGPRWSLFFEVIANLVYGFAIRLAKTGVLVGIMAASAAGLVIAAMIFPCLDGGYTPKTWWLGVARVFFSFPAGILLWRYRHLAVERVSPVAAWACVAVAGLTLMSQVPPSLRTLYEATAILVAFPLIVWLAMQYDVSGWTRTVFSKLGVTSYAVYVLHQPAALLFAAVQSRLTHLPAERLSPISGFVFASVMIIGCYALDRYYDAPVRRALTRYLARVT